MTGEKVLILYDKAALDSASADQADAIVQASAVRTALEGLGYQCEELGVSLDLRSLRNSLLQFSPSFIFNLVESIDGKGRMIAAVPMLLDALGMRYTGSPADALYLTSNKLLSKTILLSNGIPSPPSFPLEDLDKGVRGSLILKSVWEHASVGLDEDSIIDAADPSRVKTELLQRRDVFGGDGFAELYIDGREFNLSLLAGLKEPIVLPPAEIIFRDYPAAKPKVVGYRAKWEQGSFEYANTPRRFSFPETDRELLHRLSCLASQCWRVFGLRGYARVDFRVDEKSTPWVLEVNANPCLSPDAGFMAAATEAGLDTKAVIKAIIEDIP